MRTGGLRKKINCRVAFPSRKCKFKSFPMHFPFICCAVLQKQSSTGQKIQKSFLLNCKYNLNSPKSIFPHLEASSPASYKSRRQFSFRLSSLQCHPGLVFFFLPSVLACKPCCFNFFPVLPVLLEHFIFDSQLIWRRATPRFDCLQR